MLFCWTVVASSASHFMWKKGLVCFTSISQWFEMYVFLFFFITSENVLSYYVLSYYACSLPPHSDTFNTSFWKGWGATESADSTWGGVLAAFAVTEGIAVSQKLEQISLPKVWSFPESPGPSASARGAAAGTKLQSCGCPQAAEKLAAALQGCTRTVVCSTALTPCSHLL